MGLNDADGHHDFIGQAGGALALLVHYAVSGAPRPQPFLALGAALSLLGVLSGHRDRLAGGLRGHLIVVAVAPEGTGAEYPAAMLRSALAETGCSQIGRGTDLRRRLWHAGRLDSVQAAATPWTDDLLANLHDAPGDDDIGEPPCCGFYLTATPALLGGGFTSPLLARCLPFRAPLPLPPRGEITKTPPVPAELRSLLGHIAASADRPRLVPLDNQALRMRGQQQREEDRRVARCANPDQVGMLSRLCDHSSKLALIRAISRDPCAPLVGPDDMEWGWHLAEYCLRVALPLAPTPMGTDAAPRALALRIIRAAGDAGLTRTQFYRRTNSLGAARQTILAALVRDGLVLTEWEPGRTRPTLRYRAMGERE